MSVSRDHYYRLSSDLPEERIQAATALLGELQAANKTEEWDYALNRLVKGLTTSRQTARFGFSMALTELVRELVLKADYELSIASFVDKLIQTSQTSASMKGSELRSVLFGRLFGFQALLNSKLLFDTEVSSQKVLEKYVKSLVELAGTKPWLRETVMFTLCQFVTVYLQSELFDKDGLVYVLQRIQDEHLTLTVEGLAVYLTIPQPLRSQSAAKLTNAASGWKNGDPLSKGNLQTLALVLKDAGPVNEQSEESEKKDKGKNGQKQKGSWNPQIPFVWELLVKHFASSSDDVEDEEAVSNGKKRKKHGSSKQKKRAKADDDSIHFKEFWRASVDETLFADKASTERKYWGFEIFILFFKQVPADLVDALFTPNLMRCLMNHSAQNNRVLNKLSTKVLNTIIEETKKDLTKVTPTLRCLINSEYGGNWAFDNITKSKVTDSLVGILSYIENIDSIPAGRAEALALGVKEVLIELFDKTLEQQSEPDSQETVMKKSHDNALKWVLDKLLLLQRSTKRYQFSDNKFIEKNFEFLLQHAFFKSKNGKSVSGNVSSIAQDRVNSFLSGVINQKRKGHSWSLYCVKYIAKLEKNDSFEPRLELNEELALVRSQVLDLLDTIKAHVKTDDASSGPYYCFELLFSMVILQLLSGEGEAVNVLQELQTCYEDYLTKQDDEGMKISVVLTEIILSFLSRNSKLMKTLAQFVWESLLCAKGPDGKILVEEECLELLFDVLKTKENEEGSRDLFEGEEEFEEENSGSEDGDDEENDSDDDDDDESGDESDAPDSTAKVEKETTIKLAKALGVPTAESGEVKFDEIDSFGEDDDDEASDSMDDEQMMAMDDQLARIFKERRELLSANTTNNKKAQAASAKQSIMLFKSRVLDLMDSFAKVQPHSPYNLHLLRPLILLINTTKDKDLGVKAHKILKTRISKAKVTKEELEIHFPGKKSEAYKKQFLQEITWLQEQAGRYSSHQAHGQACGQCSITIAKSLVSIDEKYLEKVVQVYSQSLLEWATNPKNRIQTSLFTFFLNWVSTIREPGISLNRAMAIAARTVRSSLKSELRVAAEKRGNSEVKVAKFENGVASEAKSLLENK
ncbi:hypothetical protein FT663_00708 [Candidozyma haemuli var. vulneris]|nr:hypothetical protein FT662_01137 [[Candida] haemuloni var. vulneris]KAF3995165.1 hypothetical protein FT663_00708 [[Candida] haemuloni var. vulneris]